MLSRFLSQLLLLHRTDKFESQIKPAIVREGWNPCVLVVEMESGTATVENSLAAPQKLYTLLDDPAIALLSHVPSETKNMLIQNPAPECCYL